MKCILFKEDAVHILLFMLVVKVTFQTETCTLFFYTPFSSEFQGINNEKISPISVFDKGENASQAAEILFLVPILHRTSMFH